MKRLIKSSTLNVLGRTCKKEIPLLQISERNERTAACAHGPPLAIDKRRKYANAPDTANFNSAPGAFPCGSCKTWTHTRCKHTLRSEWLSRGSPLECSCSRGNNVKLCSSTALCCAHMQSRRCALRLSLWERPVLRMKKETVGLHPHSQCKSRQQQDSTEWVRHHFFSSQLLWEPKIYFGRFLLIAQHRAYSWLRVTDRLSFFFSFRTLETINII